MIKYNESKIKTLTKGKNCLKDACHPEVDLRYLMAFDKTSMIYQKWVVTNMRRLRDNATQKEKLFAKYLFLNDIRFVPQAPFRIKRSNGEEKVYFADFFLPDSRVIIELDGDTHLGRDAKSRDAKRDRDFRSIGIETIRITYSQLRNGEFRRLPAFVSNAGKVTDVEKASTEYRFRHWLSLPFDALEENK